MVEKTRPEPIKKEEKTEVQSEPEVKETTPAVAVNKVNSNAFRGNNSSGVSAAKNIPVKWDLADNIINKSR